jgi:predicted AAA+ superfamily ATPase
MHSKLLRHIESDLNKSLKNFPAVAILGPRQCGKSTKDVYSIKKNVKVAPLDVFISAFKKRR